MLTPLNQSREKKEDLVNYLYELLNGDRSDYELALELLDQASASVPYSAHTVYKQYFNIIDVHDKFWYCYHYGFDVRHWRTKVIMGIMMTSLINAWCLYCEKSKISLLEFRDGIILSLLK